jgi:hypothetical protein
LEDVTTDRERFKDQPTSEKMRRADDLFQLSMKELRELYGQGNFGLVRAGLCDGQKCIYHKYLPGKKGCYCRLTNVGQPHRMFYKDSHLDNCSLNGDNETPKFGCPAFKADPLKEYDRARPEYMKKVVGRQVI